jgi:sulfur-carrier protein adenylyltransferase/sulfurtransferase
MIWWLDKPGRARSERQGIADLVEKVSWLTGVRWYLGDGAALCVDFEIEYEGQSFPLTMTYAAFHPDAPPIIVPRDGSRLSGHQYGAGGSLCLEYRADNWETTITGAMMAESAHRLLSGERSNTAIEVPSAHHLSIGQSVRGYHFRFLVTGAANDRLKTIEQGRCVEVGMAEKYHAETITTAVTEIDGLAGLGAWPAGIRELTKRGYAVRLPCGISMPKPTQDGIIRLLDELGLVSVRDRALTPGEEMHLVVVNDGEPTHFYAFDVEGSRHFGRSRTLMVSEAGSRIPDEYSVLGSKLVGIVGCGSMGSKVATMLLRSGVRRFILVDDDVLLPANLIRNELSASAIGVHKVDALQARLIEVAGDIEITVRRVALGGQESADSTDSVMSALRGCDVIVDATADVHCFNFCASVARGSLIPLVWGEVFAGGAGGLVARVRSGHEPEPQAARNQIAAWCDAQGVAAPRDGSTTPYGGSSEGGAPLVADDAEVTIIASHLARFVTDVLVCPQESAFPAPVYAVGLRKAWIFSQPFETWPIQLVGAEPWKTEPEAGSVKESVELLRELLPSAFDDHNQSPK